MKNILITGGAGFIGSNFVKHIFKHYPGCQVTVLDALTYAGNIENIPDFIRNDKRFIFWYGNVRNGELVSELEAAVWQDSTGIWSCYGLPRGGVGQSGDTPVVYMK